MAEYKKFNRAGGAGSRPSFNSRPSGGRPSFGNNRPSFGGQKEMFDAECNKCNQRCQVPFRPNGKKPVYCTNCFVKDESDGNGGNSSSTYRTDSRSDSRGMTRPPQRSFNTEVPDRQIQDLKREIETMNATLKQLVITVDTFNRASALTLEIQKHFPAEKGTAKKAVVSKAPVKKATKTASKPAKAPLKKKA
jgi:CxxC-x17-CxxC domain-containing protein